MANPTNMPQYGDEGGEEETDAEGMNGDYGYGTSAGDEVEDEMDEPFEDEGEGNEEDDDSAAEQQRGILQAAGGQALASSATKKLDPMDNVKFVTLDWWIWILFTPKGWVSYLKVDSYINPTEVTIRLTILKVLFWTVLGVAGLFLVIIAVIVSVEMHPAFIILKFWIGVFS